MAIFKRFEDIQVWQKSRVLAKEVDQITKREAFRHDRRLKDQMFGSSGSVMDNIAEGHGRGGNKEFKQFLWIANGSLAELKSQLYRALDKELITKSEFPDLYAKSDEIGKMISGLVNHLKNSEMRGAKYKDD